jgi:uncharacterized protein YkwD
MQRKRLQLITVILLVITLILLNSCGNENRNPLLDGGARNDTIGKIVILPEGTPTSDMIMYDLCGQCFQLINNYRASNGLQPLKWSPTLERCARVRSAEASEYWSHTRPNGKPWYTVDSKVMRGENLAKDFTTAEDIVNAWIASPAHNELLLADDFVYIGIAEYSNYYACEFC